MPIINECDAEREALINVARLMAVSARTAPKARGVDNILTTIVTGKEKDELADAMEVKMVEKKNRISAFKRDADGVRDSPVVLLVGVRGTAPKNPENPLNCGGCGFRTCADFIKAVKRSGEDFTGPLCIFEAIDLGIALGSAVKTAVDLNVDNRLMYTLGAAARDQRFMDADAVIGIPLSSSGKNIFFDRE